MPATENLSHHRTESAQQRKAALRLTPEELAQRKAERERIAAERAAERLQRVQEPRRLLACFLARDIGGVEGKFIAQAVGVDPAKLNAMLEQFMPHLQDVATLPVSVAVLEIGRRIQPATAA